MTTPPYGRQLEGVISAPVIDVVTEAGDEEGQHLNISQKGEQVTVVVEQVAKVSHREGVVPVVIRGVSISLLHHQQKSSTDILTLQTLYFTRFSLGQSASLYSPAVQQAHFAHHA